VPAFRILFHRRFLQKLLLQLIGRSNFFTPIGRLKRTETPEGNAYFNEHFAFIGRMEKGFYFLG